MADLGQSDIHRSVAARLQTDDQRYTANRRTIVDTLASQRRPLSIPQILDANRGLAQSSAYRNLAVLERVGAVHRIVTNDEFARYELAEDLTGHHHHTICSRCGAVDDFTFPSKIEVELVRALKRVAQRTQFRSEGHRVDLVGLCADCT